MNDQQKPGPSGIKSEMTENLDDFLRYFNIVRDDHQARIDEKPLNDQWENDVSKFLFENNSNDDIDFDRPEFDSKDVAEIDKLLANFIGNTDQNEDEKKPQQKAFINPNLYKLKFNEKKMFRLFRENMLYDPMDDILEKIESKKRKHLTTEDDSCCSDSDNDNDDHDHSNSIVGDGDECQSEISLYSDIGGGDDDEDDDSSYRNKKLKTNERIGTTATTSLEQGGSNLPLSSSSSNTMAISPKKEEPIEQQPICRRLRRPTLRKDYLSSLPRHGNVFNLIRYSCTSRIAQDFLKTTEGRQQVLDAIKNCRNMSTLIIPEEETAKPSKVLLISQQNFKKSKSANHKFRNSGWHRQLNQGVKMESFLFQTNFRFLKKNLNQSWFIEEKKQEKIEDNTPSMNFINDHGCFKSVPIGLSILYIPVCVEELKTKLLKKFHEPPTNRLEQIETSIISDVNWLRNQQIVTICPKPSSSSSSTKSITSDNIDIDEFRSKRIAELNDSMNEISNNDDIWENFIKFDRKCTKTKTESRPYFNMCDNFQFISSDMNCIPIVKRIKPDIFDDSEDLKQLWIRMKSSNEFPSEQFFQQTEKLVNGRQQILRLESLAQRPDYIQMHGMTAILESIADNHLIFSPFFSIE
ncbi:hypothetical protein DERP_013144 [Dermatophagoides pteronyssinus]|uniref:Uncharacterized protein n=1 Tax=Dermatophagoides pteronyssinus TaxID=6956 RepID=A0ABQ8J5U8_DERPT|nr:hypothetical protein DERP_013144 [Dermatophagoides pteronyssinus]